MKKDVSKITFSEKESSIIIDILTEMLSVLKNTRYEISKPNDSIYYDSADVKRLLNISDSTLCRIRKEKSIPFIRFGRKIYYPKSFFTNAIKK